MAAKRGQTDAIRLLIEKGANVNSCDRVIIRHVGSQ